MNEEQRRLCPYVTIEPHIEPARSRITPLALTVTSMVVILIISLTQWVGENFALWSRDADIEVDTLLAGVAVVIAGFEAFRRGDRALIRRMMIRAGELTALVVLGTAALAAF